MYIQLILKTNKVKNIKDTAPFILISWAWVKTVPVPSTVGQCSIADGHVLASGSCTSGSVAILLIINRCLLSGPKILKRFFQQCQGCPNKKEETLVQSHTRCQMGNVLLNSGM